MIAINSRLLVHSRSGSSASAIDSVTEVEQYACVSLCLIAVFLAAASGTAFAQVPLAEPPSRLVRDVVFNELHDHAAHGYWRYMVQKRSQQETRLEQQVETTDGTVARLVLRDGIALSPESQQSEDAKLDHLLASSTDRERLRQEHSEDERRIGLILSLLPDAFLFEFVGEERGRHHLRFHPNPEYPVHSIEARVFHAMSGDIWIDTRMKHLMRLDGQLQSNVDFGYGILGRLYKGGWFRLERVQVNATDWKTQRLEVHMSGRTLLFRRSRARRAKCAVDSPLFRRD